jgi:hypothetical protein
MLSRRELIAAGAGMHMAGGGAAAVQNDADIRALRGDVQEIRSLLTASPINIPTVTSLRDRQRQFFRLNQRFPECIDVGIRVWEIMQDWHIRNLRPLNINRGGDGRWQMDFIMSVLVLRHELPDNEIGQPYDR